MTDYSYIPEPDPTRPPTAEEAKLFAEAVEAIERGEGCLYYSGIISEWKELSNTQFAGKAQQYRPIPEREKVTSYYIGNKLISQGTANVRSKEGYVVKVLEFYPDELPDYVPEGQW